MRYYRVLIITICFVIGLTNGKICRLEIPYKFVSHRKFGQMNVTDTQNFTELLTSDFYFDKTPLIKLLLIPNEYKIVEVVIPSKWGKSINLDMMKTILQIPVNCHGTIERPLENSVNYRLFYNSQVFIDNDHIKYLKQPLNILRGNTLLDKYLGKYPVIYLDFSQMNACSYAEIIDITTEKIREAFHRHSYLEAVIENKINTTISSLEKNKSIEDLNYYRKLLNDRIDYEQLIKSLEFLSYLLYKHFSARCYVLVDNYEGVLLNALANSKISDIDTSLALAFFSSLMVRTFQTNTYVEKGILTGTFPLLKTVHNLEKFKRFRGVLYNAVYLNHGVPQEDLITLFDYLQIPSDLRTRALNWYTGHHWGKSPTIQLYNTYAIARFVTTGKIQCCSNRNVIFDGIFRNTLNQSNTRFFVIDKILGHYREMIRGETHTICTTTYLNLKNYLIGSKTLKKFELNEAIEPFLVSVGLLAPCNHRDTIMHISVPSNEARLDLSEKLMEYYKSEFHIPSNMVDDAVENLADFITRQESLNNLTSFLISLLSNDLLMKDVSEYDRSYLGNFRKFMLFVLNYLTLRLALSYDFTIESIQDFDIDLGKCRWHNLAVSINKTVSFIELVVNASSVQDAIDIAKGQKDRIEKFLTTYDSVQFIGINVGLDRGLEMTSVFLQ